MCPSRRVPCNMWRQAAWHRWCNMLQQMMQMYRDMSPANSAHDYILSVHPRGDEQDEQDVNCHRCTYLTGQGTWQRYLNASCTPARGLNSGGVRSLKTLTLCHISPYISLSAHKCSPPQPTAAKVHSTLQVPTAPRFLLATATEMLILLYKPPVLTIKTWITFWNNILVTSMNDM